jgi:translation elongation factor EF-G
MTCDVSLFIKTIISRLRQYWIIKGKVTLEACKDFATQLFTITEGRGMFETIFWQYQKVENNSRTML